MSTKELVVELRFPLPGDHFDQARFISQAGEAVEALRAAVPEGLEYNLTSEIIARRATGAGANGAAKPRPRKTPEPPAAGATGPAQ